jgi:hypothetical protein
MTHMEFGGEAQFQAEIRDDWAYTSEHRSLLARAREDSARDRVRELSEDELCDLADIEQE